MIQKFINWLRDYQSQRATRSYINRLARHLRRTVPGISVQRISSRDREETVVVFPGDRIGEVMEADIKLSRPGTPFSHKEGGKLQ